jgi:hypothetical protein
MSAPPLENAVHNATVPAIAVASVLPLEPAHECAYTVTCTAAHCSEVFIEALGCSEAYELEMQCKNFAVLFPLLCLVRPVWQQALQGTIKQSKKQQMA